ncbi:hypothetical protein BCR42DRAFT_421391 [Absidia repens]|uniref:Uncharacterized protein n=1 Tax=Absidia repens TaxID=90262 RepID=A0A1X2I8I7_9FUNG|nr:hypothetical protein BCR42DRAFT_421391 [Absidia repens]
MKSFTLLLYIVAMSMIVSAQYVHFIYNPNDRQGLMKPGSCVPFLNPAGMPPTAVRVELPTICQFYNDNHCQTVAQNIRSLRLNPGPFRSLGRPPTVPRTMLCFTLQ